MNKNAVQNIPQSRCSASEDTAAQLSHSPGQQHRGRIYCSWLCATCAHRRSLLRCSNLSACTCRCSCAVVLICACICSFFSPYPACVCVCLWMILWCGSRNRLVLGLELGAPNSVAAKGRSAAVPVNDVWEERGADKDSYSSARADVRRTCAHTHAQTHRDWRVQVYLQSDCQLMFIHRQSHLSSAATNYCHPRI